MLEQSPSEILAERISDIELSRSKLSASHDEKWERTLRKQRAFNCAGLIAIRAVHAAAAAGNVQCKKAAAEMAAFLQTISQPQ